MASRFDDAIPLARERPERVDSTYCRGCEKVFGLFFRRKRFCSHCGLAFCGTCASRKLPIPHLDYPRPTPVCAACHTTLMKVLFSRGDSVVSMQGFDPALREMRKLPRPKDVISLPSYPSLDGYAEWMAQNAYGPWARHYCNVERLEALLAEIVRANRQNEMLLFERKESFDLHQVKVEVPGAGPRGGGGGGRSGGGGDGSGRRRNAREEQEDFAANSLHQMWLDQQEQQRREAARGGALSSSVSDLGGASPRVQRSDSYVDASRSNGANLSAMSLTQQKELRPSLALLVEERFRGSSVTQNSQLRLLSEERPASAGRGASVVWDDEDEAKSQFASAAVQQQQQPNGRASGAVEEEKRARQPVEPDEKTAELTEEDEEQPGGTWSSVRSLHSRGSAAGAAHSAGAPAAVEAASPPAAAVGSPRGVPGVSGDAAPRASGDRVDARREESLAEWLQFERENQIHPRSLENLVPLDIYSEAEERLFFVELQRELVKINRFYVKQQSNALHTLNRIVRHCNQLPKEPAARDREIASLRRQSCELYQELEHLQNYRILNYIALSGIMRKHDAVAEFNNASATVMPVILGSRFFSSVLTFRMIAKLEQVYELAFATQTGTRARREEALRTLRSLNQPPVPSVTGLDSLLVGIALALLALCGVLLSHVPEGGNHPSLVVVYPLARGVALAVLYLLLWSFVLFRFHAARINFDYLFDVDPRSRLHYPHVLRLAAALLVGLLLAAAVYLYQVVQYGAATFVHGGVAWAALLGLCLVALVLPIDVAGLHTRKWLLHQLGLALLSPVTAVDFSGFFLAEQLTSLVVPLTDLVFACCFYLSRGFLDNETSGCMEFSEWSHFIVAWLVLWVRFWQAIKRLYVTREKRNRTVALRYLLAGLVPFAAYVQGRAGLSTMPVTLWSWVAIVALLMAHFWDCKHDMGLWAAPGETAEDVKVRPHTLAHKVASVANFFLRGAWVITLSPRVFGLRYERHRFLWTLVAALEIARRHLWNFYVVEYDNIFNRMRFRVAAVVPLPLAIPRPSAAHDRNRALWIKPLETREKVEKESAKDPLEVQARSPLEHTPYRVRVDSLRAVINAERVRQPDLDDQPLRRVSVADDAPPNAAAVADDLTDEAAAAAAAAVLDAGAAAVASLSVQRSAPAAAAESAPLPSPGRPVAAPSASLASPRSASREPLLLAAGSRGRGTPTSAASAPAAAPAAAPAGSPLAADQAHLTELLKTAQEMSSMWAELNELEKRIRSVSDADSRSVSEADSVSSRGSSRKSKKKKKKKKRSRRSKLSSQRSDKSGAEDAKEEEREEEDDDDDDDKSDAGQGQPAARRASDAPVRGSAAVIQERLLEEEEEAAAEEDDADLHVSAVPPRKH